MRWFGLQLSCAIGALVCSVQPGWAAPTTVVVNADAGEDGAVRIAELEPSLIKHGYDPRANPSLVSSEPTPRVSTATPAHGASLRKQAFEAYAAFRYKDALRLLAQAEASLLKAMPSKIALDELGKVALLRGQVQLLSGKRGADENFRLARRLLGKDELDPGLYPPKISNAYREALNSTQASASEITWAAEPGLVVVIDGVEKTSGTKLEDGPHYLVMKRPGYVTQSRLLVTRGVTKLAPTWTPAPPGERTASLRQGLTAAPKDARLLAELAAATGGERIIVVFRGETNLALALFSTASNSVSRAQPATPEGVAALLKTPTLDPREVVSDPGGSPTGPTDDRGFYRRNRTAVLVTAGALVVVAGVITAVLLVRAADSGADIDSFCGLGFQCP